MAAYMIFIRKSLDDADAMQTYSAQVPGSFAGHRVKPLAIYGAMEVLEGGPSDGVVIAEFPTMEEARAWYHSPAYQAAIPDRHRAGDYQVILVEGA
jgi:uncharacterized protein (DUF1330 family)